MAAKSAIWDDIERDLECAANEAAKAVVKARSLDDAKTAFSDDAREDRERAIGSHLHNSYGGMESAVERIVRLFDKELPTGANYHIELIDRASRPIHGVRPAVISADTATDLHRLRTFRHVFRTAYGRFDYQRAKENVPVVERCMTSFSKDVTAFGREVGLLRRPLSKAKNGRRAKKNSGGGA
jgi:hypothetical protein